MNNLLTTKEFVRWLIEQPLDTTFDYEDEYNCIFSRYLRAKGFPVRCVLRREWIDTDENCHKIPRPVADALLRLESYGATYEDVLNGLA